MNNVKAGLFTGPGNWSMILRSGQWIIGLLSLYAFWVTCFLTGSSNVTKIKVAVIFFSKLVSSFFIYKMLTTRFFTFQRTTLVHFKFHSILNATRFYNTGLLRKTTTLPDRVGLELSKDRSGKLINTIYNYHCIILIKLFRY